MEEQKKKFNAKKLWLIIILISIILVPAFYGFTYLKSYWNNGTTINKVPIAVVNLDTPYTKDGTTYDVGQTLVNNLKTNNDLDWQFVSYKDAENGLYGDKYYAMIVIPKDFSQKIADATTDGFKKPQIDFYQNQGKNYIFAEISGIGVDQVAQTVSASISKSVSNVLVQTIYKTKDGFKSAAEGSSQLQSGISKLSNGSSALVSGMNKLESGASELNGGVNKLQTGSSGLVSGLDKLHSGSQTLVSGTTKLQDGSEKLVGGLSQLQGGSNKLVSGINELQTGSSSLVNGMQTLANGSEKLTSGANQLNGATESLTNGLSQLQGGAKAVASGQAGIGKEMQILKELIASGQTAKATELLGQMSEQNAQMQQGVAALSGGIDKAQNGAQQIQAGANSLSSGMQALNSGIVSAKSGASKLNGGISQVATGSTALNAGLSQVTDGASALNTGVAQLGSGAKELNSGIGTASSGAGQLNDGIKTVGTGVGALNSGIKSAGSGAGELNSGLASAKSGSEKLNSGLESGYNNLNDNVTFTAEEMSEFIANPVTLNTISINPVSSYGEGFAPYFMCIAIFVGAMYTYYMVSALSRKFKGSFFKRFVRMYLIGAILCVLQALVMSAFIYWGLGIHTSTPAWFFEINVITIIAVYSMMNGLHYVITPIMKGALVVIMVLQFTACGGSYPVLVMPTFYNVIHPFLILSYGVDTMRMAISGINYSIFNRDVAILVLFIVGFTILGFVVGYLKNHITHKRVLKERSELIADNETFNQYV
ncbi:MAG: YhgE/Pip family protein [Sarcina sp.]